MEWPRQPTYVVTSTLQFTGILLSLVQDLLLFILSVLQNFLGPILGEFVRIIRIFALSTGARRDSDGAQVEYTVDTTGEAQRDQAVNIMSNTTTLLTDLQTRYDSEYSGSGPNPFASATLTSTSPVAVQQSTGEEDTSSSKKTTDSKLIAGAVVGGVFGLLLLVALALFIVRSKREVRAAPKKSSLRNKGDVYRNPAYDPSGSGERSASVYQAATMASPEYDLASPNDPCEA